MSRGEEVLQRLSVYNKVTETVVLGTAKNSRNFLFQTVSAVEETLKIQVRICVRYCKLDYFTTFRIRSGKQLMELQQQSRN